MQLPVAARAWLQELGILGSSRKWLTVLEDPCAISMAPMLFEHTVAAGGSGKSRSDRWTAIKGLSTEYGDCPVISMVSDLLKRTVADSNSTNLLLTADML